MRVTSENHLQLSAPPQEPLSSQALLDHNDQVWLPFDRQTLKHHEANFCMLSEQIAVHNANIKRFRIHYTKLQHLLIINGMGVALGDSIIGMSVLMWLLDTYPQLHITLWRSAHTPSCIEDVYVNRSARLHIKKLPQPASSIFGFDATIDISDFMYRSDFDHMAMIDFFLESLGIDPLAMPVSEKSNAWLSRAFPIKKQEDRYILFCPQASAKLRCIPDKLHTRLIDLIWKRYSLPIKGFSAAKHPAFADLTDQSHTLNDFIKHIQHATAVVTTDSAAVHIAAGFSIPTIAYFVSIRPEKRVRDYPFCHGIHLDPTMHLDGLHTTEDPAHLHYAHTLWEGLALK